MTSHMIRLIRLKIYFVLFYLFFPHEHGISTERKNDPFDTTGQSYTRAR